MPYVTGSATSVADLIDKIQDACTANGWTLSGDVLHRGDAHIRLWEQSATELRIQGGTGIDGSNALTGAAPSFARLVQFTHALAQAWVWPMTYEVFLFDDPDEVYVVANFAIDYYLWLAWGISDVVGLPGTGLWFGAMLDSAGATVSGIGIATPGQNQAGNPNNCALFQQTIRQQRNSFVHHGLDGGGWTAASENTAVSHGGWFAIEELVRAQPLHSWNGAAVLLPMQSWVDRGSSAKSLAVDCRHARHLRIDNINPGQVLTLGSDRWKVFPWYRKDTSHPQGWSSTGGQDSGTFGWAIRYEGP